MKAVQLEGKEARIATLQAKISIARLRATHGKTKKMRDEQTAALATYTTMLAKEMQ